jgi:hypothetical protein
MLIRKSLRPEETKQTLQTLDVVVAASVLKAGTFHRLTSDSPMKCRVMLELTGPGWRALMVTGQWFCGGGGNW